MLAGMPEAAIQAFVDLAGPGSASTLLVNELRQLGGALSRPHPGAGAMPMLDGEFLALGVGIAATPEMGAAGAAGRRRDSSRRWRRSASGRQYLNFVEHADRSEHRVRPGHLGPAGHHQVGLRPRRGHRGEPPGAQDLRDRGLSASQAVRGNRSRHPLAGGAGTTLRAEAIVARCGTALLDSGAEDLDLRGPLLRTAGRLQDHRRTGGLDDVDERLGRRSHRRRAGRAGPGRSRPRRGSCCSAPGRPGR